MQERAVIYARYSSDKQTEQSIEGQLHVCKEYAEKNNLQIVGEYIDRAKTGRNDNREGFQNMLKDSANESFSIVLVYALDRFSRDRYDSAIHKATLKKNGVKLISATQPISDSPEGILLESLLEGLAEYYSVELSQKLARGRRESVEKGQYIGGFIPYGYKVEDKKFVINEKESENVKTIFRLFLSGKTYKEIVNYLNSQQILNRKNKAFRIHSLHYILQNQAYTGKYIIGEYTNENAFPQIISFEDFKEVQKRVEKTYKKHSNSEVNFLLTGKLFCGLCGSTMTGDSGTSKTGKKMYYYTCLKHKKEKKCSLRSIRKERLEKFVYQKAVEQLKSPNMLNSISEKLIELNKTTNYEEDLKRLKNSLQSVNSKIDNLVAAVSNGIINDKIKIENEELCKRKEELEAQISDIQNSPLLTLTKEKIEDFIIKRFSKANMETIIESLIYKVYLYPDHIVIIFNLYKPDKNDKRELYEQKFDLSSACLTKLAYASFFIFHDSHGLKLG